MISSDIKIAVIGLWHLGEVVTASFASMGYSIVAIDEDKKVIENFKKEILPVQEPGVLSSIKKNKKRIFFSNKLSDAKDSDFIFLTIDTPVKDNDEPDLTILFDVVGKLKKINLKNKILVIMSQVPVGTTKKLADILNLESLYFPENLQLGQAMKYFLKPDRFIIGIDNPTVAKKFLTLIEKIKTEKIIMSVASAEMSKHALNAFLATSLSFIYNISDICEKVGADIKDVSLALKTDFRIGKSAYLDTSLGFSGGTLMRDLKTLKKVSVKNNIKTPVIEATIKTNEERIKSIVKLLKEILKTSLFGISIGILGVTYKTGTSTLRRSLAVDLYKALKKEGAKIKVYDSEADKKEMLDTFGRDRKNNPYDTVRGCMAVVLITAWPEFRLLNFSKLQKEMKPPHLFFDTRGFLSDIGEGLEEYGIYYKRVGKSISYDFKK